MLLFETVKSLQSFLSEQKGKGNTVGFVPTMGALHEGHTSLIKRAKSENDFSLCSIFVNPSQFNNQKDLTNYPRDKAGDLKILEDVGCDILFLPTETEIYPEKRSEKITLGRIEEVLEGEHRPGHFSGVSTVVKRFFEIISPDRAYFGLKDYQQFAVVKAMTKKLDFNIEIVGCETKREKDGLAMSSRNRLLTETGREDSILFYKSLKKAHELVALSSVDKIKNQITSDFEKSSKCQLEYFEIVDSNTLERVINVKDHNSVVACIAGFVEEVRLIDNLILIP